MILMNQRGKHTDAEMATSTNIPKAASCQFGHKRCRKGRCSTHVTIVPSNSHRGQTSLIDDNTLLINTEETSESFQASALAAAISGLSRYKTKTCFSSLVQSSSLVLQHCQTHSKHSLSLSCYQMPISWLPAHCFQHSQLPHVSLPTLPEAYVSLGQAAWGPVKMLTG